MSVFVDTSAFLAILDADDRHHSHAGQVWSEIVRNSQTVVTSNYLVIETTALLQRRLDKHAVRRFQADILPLVHISWVEQDVHNAGMAAVLASSRRGPGVVDCVSFELMRRLDIWTAFTYDKHFADAGFQVL